MTSFFDDKINILSYNCYMIKDHQESSLKFKKQKYTLKIFLVVSLVVFLLVFCGVINVLIKNKNEDNDIQKLSQKADEIRNKNKEIKSLINTYSTETNKEAMARENLNVMKEGENVVVINDKKTEIQITKKKTGATKNNKVIPNYNKWINFFFEKDDK